jgi:hypothetical protein
LLFKKDTFTVSKFRELVKEKILTKLRNKYNNTGSIDTNFCTLSINNELNLLLNDIQWRNSPSDCQILRVGSQGWQKGKIRIHVDTKILYPLDSRGINEIHICIEFCPDEPTASESPLDDLRQLPEYKQQNPKAP